VRFDWRISISTEPRRASDDSGDVTRSVAIMRWAIIGLAVVGVAAIIIYRVAFR
jgi:hypothetical protein